MTRRTTFLLLVVEETDDAETPPSLPPPFEVETTAEPVAEPARPLAKCLPSNVVPLRRVGS